MNSLNVLYEDNHVIVVYKPANILSQSDITGDKDLLTMVKEYVKVKYNKPGNVYIGLVHRLDRPVEGIMVFARSSKAASRLSDQIKNHLFHKSYLAIVEGELECKVGQFTDYLQKLENGNTIVSDSKHGKESKLEYKVLDYRDGKSLVDINLITGRHHQIRVQFSSRNHPLVGDSRYGNMNGENICLCSYKLSFLHPISKEELCFQIKPSSNSSWNAFL